MKRARHFALGLILLASVAQANPAHTATGGKLCGEGTFRFFGFTLYDAKLYGSCRAPVFEQPFALELKYQRSFTRAQLVQSSLDELERMNALPDEATRTRWEHDMQQAFADVKAGDTFTGHYHPEEGARFYLNGEPTAQIRDPLFARHFFGIWLDRETRAPGLRASLLGEAQP